MDEEQSDSFIVDILHFSIILVDVILNPLPVHIQPGIMVYSGCGIT